MSSLQKFHRRTQTSVVAAIDPFPTIGSGSNTVGYWLGTAGDTINKLIVAPKSTESTSLTWGSSSTTRSTNNSDGLINTYTLYSFGSAAHPAAYYCKSLTTGGYNTWYLPALNELKTIYSNKSATPFATANSLTIPGSAAAMSSTEYSATGQMNIDLNTGAGQYIGYKGGTGDNIRAVRKYVLTASAPNTVLGSGNSTLGFWIGTAGNGVSKLIVAPKMTDVSLSWGSSGTARGTISTTDGLSNTNTLYALGSAAHPAAYYAKSLSTGGYNTWYMPAGKELLTIYSNKSAYANISANDYFGNDTYWSSTESSSTKAIFLNFANGLYGPGGYVSTKNPTYKVKAVRRGV